MFDVLIIGAGLSGLTTAYKILQKEPSLRLKILEASDTIGGQIASKPDEELGGKWIMADQTHIYNLLADLGIHMRRRPPVSRNLHRSWALDVGPFALIAKFELQRYMNDLDLMSQLFRPGTYDLTAEDRKNSMWHHITRSMFFESSRLFMLNFIRLVTGVDAKEICFVEFMNILHSCGDLKTLMQLYIEPSQSSILEFSPEQLLGAFENRLQSVIIKRLTKVTEIQHHSDFVQVSETNGSIHTAKVIVLAIPSNHIEEIFITPPVPPEWDIPYLGDKYYITSFKIQYDEAHWRRKGFSGNFYSADPAIFAQQYKQTSLVGYVLHRQGFELLIKSIVLKSIGESFGNELTDPVEFNQQTYEQTSLKNLPYTTPWNRIIWSSTSTATLYRGFLNGAVQSGLRSAVHALLILRPQSITWQDLAEIQKASVVYRYPSHWDLLKSSVNVYNSVVYSTIALVVFCLVKNRNKFFN